MAAAALAAAIGCGNRAGLSTPDASSETGGDAGLEAVGDAGGVLFTLGTAATDGSGFLPMAGDITMVAGGQGGFHVWMKFRVSGAPAEMVTLAYTIRRVSDQHLVLNAMQMRMLGAPAATGYWELPTAIPSFLCPSPIGVQVRDEPMHYLLDVSAMDGSLVGSAEADFTPHCPDGDAHCMSICSG
jgi:hypothetical protein